MGWAQQVGGSAVGANDTCALRLWEGLKLWLYVNITSDACGRAGQSVCFGPRALQSPRTRWSMHGYPAGVQDRREVRLGCLHTRRRRRCGMKATEHKNAGYHKWGCTPHRPVYVGMHTLGAPDPSHGFTTSYIPRPNSAALEVVFE